MQYDSKVNQVFNFKFFDVKNSGYYSRDSQINNFEFLSPKNQIIFCHQKIGETVRDYFFFYILIFYRLIWLIKILFIKRG